jgi:hypothetical protein
MIVPSTVVHTQKKIQHFQFTYQQQLGQLDAQQYEYVQLLIYSNGNVASTKLFLWSCRKTHREMKVLAVFFLYAGGLEHATL